MTYDQRTDEILQAVYRGPATNEVHFAGDPLRAVNAGNPPKRNDETMTTPTREEIDARLETISTKMAGDVKAIAAEMAGSVKVIEARIDGNIANLAQIIETKFAEANASHQKASTDTFKWVIGTMIAIGGVGLAFMTFLINNAGPKSAPAAPTPIIIYAQPAPAAPPPVAPPAKP